MRGWPRVLSLLAKSRPAIALPLLLLGTAVVVVMSLVDASDPMKWKDLWDAYGPVVGISGFAVSVPAAVYGYYHRARVAGLILAASCGVSLFAGLIMGTQEGPLVGGSTSAGVLPGLIAGLVLLIVGDDN
jgi:hypothetical protein